MISSLISAYWVDGLLIGLYIYYLKFAKSYWKTILSLFLIFRCMLTEEEMMNLDMATHQQIELFTQIMYFAQVSHN